MRIIAGKYRGRVIPSPRESVVKPTLDRVKENVFNIIQMHVKDSKVLDLFCGSGALGLECLSRGAKEVHFVDNNENNIMRLEKFLQTIWAEHYFLHHCDYYDALWDFAGEKKFDIIFLDPPFDSDLAQKAIAKILKFDLLVDGGIIVWEHPHDVDKSFIKDKIFDTRKYGTIEIDFIKRKSNSTTDGENVKNIQET